MYRKFAFEGDVHEALDCVPLTVRRKLDLARLKISLAGWQSLSRGERLALCHLPVETEEDVAVYREILAAFAERAGAAVKDLPIEVGDRRAWGAGAVPAVVEARASSLAGAPLARLRAAWGGLTEEERYALFKLSNPEKSPEKLHRALTELGLVGPLPPNR